LVGLFGMNERGVVTGWYFNGDFTIAGTFLWTRTGSIRKPESEPLDLIASTISNSGVVGGYNEDYDVEGWSGFVLQPGDSFADASFIRVPRFPTTMLFEINERGDLLGHAPHR
jgi:hypothetical protein